MSDTVLHIKYFYNCHYNIFSKLLLLFSLYRWKKWSIKYITCPNFHSEPAFKLRLCLSRVQVLNSLLYSRFSKQHYQWLPSLLCCKPCSTSQILNPSNWADAAGIALHPIWPPLSNHFFKNLVVCRDEFYTRFHFIPLQVTFLGFLNLMKSDNSVCVFGWHFESRIALLFLWIMSSQCIL